MSDPAVPYPTPSWSPGPPPVTHSDLEQCPILVLHYWAVWDLHDREMDRRLAALREEYAGRVCFRSCDIDRPDNRPFIRGIANIPALGCFIRGKWFESLIGLRSEAQLRSALEIWLVAVAAADCEQRTHFRAPSIVTFFTKLLARGRIR